MGRKGKVPYTLLLLCLFLSCHLLYRHLLPHPVHTTVPHHPDHPDLPITSDPIVSLSYLASLPPPVPPSPSCLPPALLPPPPSCQAETNTGLSGERVGQPRAVVMMIMFGFEVDTLEIALREQLEYLDKIFIVESTLNQKGVAIAGISHYH